MTVTAGQATARIQVTQLGDTTLPIIYRKLDDLHSSAISPDGNIVGGYYSTADDESYSKMTVVFIDLRTGERTEFGPYPESLILPTSVSCVTSQGLMYVVNGQGDMFAFDMHERNYFIPEVAGYATIQVNSSSAYGTKWVGRATGKGETMYVPLISENGTVRELPRRSSTTATNRTAWALSPAASPPTARLPTVRFGTTSTSAWSIGTRRAMSIT